MVTETLVVMFTHGSREAIHDLLVWINHASIELTVAKQLVFCSFKRVTKHVVLRLFVVAIFQVNTEWVLEVRLKAENLVAKISRN